MCHVLIIEDEPIIAMSIEDTLRDAGATSFSFAVTEDEAVAEATKQKPGFITSDVNLLSGSGPVALVRIGKLLGRIPSVLITGNKDVPEVGHLPFPVLSKPFIPSSLAATFNKCRLC